MPLPDHVSEALPQRSGFLRNYVEYASACSDAPPVFHAGIGLTIFAGAVAHRISCPWTAGRRLMPNLYTLIVGPSTTARKTTALDAGSDVLYRAVPDRCIPVPGTYEELVAELRRQAHGVLTFREFAHFLKMTAKGYAAPQRTALLDLYDWPSERPYTRNLKKGATIIRGPICLSMLASIGNEALHQFVDTGEWFGGFFGRMLLIYGERDDFQMPLGWENGRDFLAYYLGQFAQYPTPPCLGFQPDAWEWFSGWCKRHDDHRHQLSTRTKSFAAGVAGFAAKIALLFAIDGGAAWSEHPWYVPTDALYHATRFIDNMYLPSAIKMGETLVQLSTWEQYRQRVLDTIDATGDIGISHRDLLRKTRVTADNLEQATETLRAEGTIEITFDGGPGDPSRAKYRCLRKDFAPTNSMPPPPGLEMAAP